MIKRMTLTEEQIRRGNSHILKLMSMYLNVFSDVITLDMVNEVSKSCNQTQESTYSQLLAAVLQVDSVNRDRAFYNAYFPEMIHKLDAKCFMDNPYYKNIKISEKSIGRCELKNLTLPPCEPFVCNDFKITDDKRLIPQIGFFTKPFTYPAVTENNREWMTLMPNEIITTEPAVSASRGRVLTYGLGLGYFVYMASQKTDVESVTVVELNKDVITLFETVILPQIPNKSKINIINADALKFAETENITLNYDFVFADIWRDVSDGKELYLKFKKLEKGSDVKYMYWLENTIKCYLDKHFWPSK